MPERTGIPKQRNCTVRVYGTIEATTLLKGTYWVNIYSTRTSTRIAQLVLSNLRTEEAGVWERIRPDAATGDVGAEEGDGEKQ